MKTKKKKITTKGDLDKVIKGGKAQAEEKRPTGRPKSEVPKERAHFYLPENIIQAIDQNSMGNKSVFAEFVFKFYFDQHNIKY